MNNERIGQITASRYSSITTGGKTKDSYLIDIVLEELGLKNNWNTEHTIHGKNFESKAFEIIKNIYPNSVYQSNIYIPINEYCGASPDIISEINGEKVVIDIKCPYEDSFFKHKEYDSLLSKNNVYYYQLQMQMLATKADYGLIGFFLFKPKNQYIDQSVYEDYTEEELPFRDKFYFHRIEKNNDIIDKIIDNVYDCQEELDIIRFLLKGGMMNDISLKERLNLYEEGFCFKKFKDFSFREIFKNKEKVYYFNEDFYVLKKIR